MPNKEVLELKKAQVASIKERLDKAVAGVLVDYTGISVADDTALRKELREAGVEYSVVKNTILHLAVEGTDLAEIDSVLKGSTALATCESDHVAAARILGKYAGDHKEFTIKAGFLEGKTIDLATIDALAKLPSREILLATVCNAFNAPIAAFARAIQAIVDKDGAPAEAAAE